MKVLVLNAGSSSLKYQVIDMDNEEMIGKGQVERIGAPNTSISQSVNGKKVEAIIDAKDVSEAVGTALEWITDKEHGIISSLAEIGAVGHRVLHSGEDFNDSVLVGEAELAIFKKNKVFGPLHMPANIMGIERIMDIMPGVPNVAVFDTTFHSTMPKHAYMYAINMADYEEFKIRKYGFHGTSHKYVTSECAKMYGSEQSKIITCHLGNGSSLAAVVNGKCVDTTMGLTPLEGLVMGTRSGDLDPAVIGFLAENKGMTAEQVVNYLNKDSGLKGICGYSDCRDITAHYDDADGKAKLAFDMFSYRIKKYIGSYIAAMGGLDAIVMTGGIGENSAFARKLIFEGLESLGIEFDFEKNETKLPDGNKEMHKSSSKVKIYIIPTNEE
ncbi:MAG: acetate kinase, partial [Bacillota bacterium]